MCSAELESGVDSLTRRMLNKQRIKFRINSARENVKMMELQIIQSKMKEIRGQRVMLDFDLAELYGVEAKRIKFTGFCRCLEVYDSGFSFIAFPGVGRN